jgi:two-component system OmpR family response regulator
MMLMQPADTAGICEDDDEVREVLRAALERAGFSVRSTATGSEAVRLFADSPPDVLVLDIGLPDADGRDVCQALRARGVETPVIFLTARDALTDRLSGFHSGGDDYLTKPFAVCELLVRIEALRRRTPHASPGAAGEFALDPAGHALTVGENSVHLTPTEFRLLARIAARPGEVVRRKTLAAAGWPDGAIVHDNTLDVYVSRLRSKLRKAGANGSIATVNGVGYKLA